MGPGQSPGEHQQNKVNSWNSESLIEQSFLPSLSALTPYPIRSLSIFLAIQSHSATMLKYLMPCLILVSLFLNIPRPSQNLAFITSGPLNKVVVHLMTQPSALLPLLLLLLSLLDLTILTPFFMAFQLNMPLVSSRHKTPLHVLSQVLASLTLNSSTLKRLHWLPIDACIRFKIATLTYRALHTGNPPYLASLLHRHNPCRALRSASANVLSVTRSNFCLLYTSPSPRD